MDITHELVSAVSISAEAYSAVNMLFVALLNVALVQIIGYFMKDWKLVTPEMLAGVGAFSGIVSLPALLFRAVAVLDFSTVPLDIVGALFAGKMLMLLLSTALGKVTANSHEAGSVELTSGVFALLITNSDDLGLGLPVMGAIFEPAMVNMCFVLAALQTSVINPMIFILLGIGMARRDAPADGAPASTGEVVRAVLRSLTKNLIVVACFSGLVYNGVFGGFGGATLPFYLDNLTKLLGAAFGPIVLFISGAANVGSFGELGRLDSALMPLLTCMLKSLVLPTIVMCGVSLLGGSREHADFAFAFSSLPAAGSTLVFASKYQPSKELSSLLAASLALGKMIGFPLLFLSAAIFKTHHVREVVEIEESLAAALHHICAVPVLILVASTLWYPRWSRPPYQTILIVVLFTLGYLSTSLVAQYLPDPQPRPVRALLFVACSFFRWGADAALVIAAYARHLEAQVRDKELTRGVCSELGRSARGLLEQQLLTAGASHGGTALFAGQVGRSHPSERKFLMRLAMASAAGLVITLPFYLVLDYLPSASGTPPHLMASGQLPLWLPYGAWQASAYSVAYAVAAALLLIFTASVMRYKVMAQRLLHKQMKDGERAVRHFNLKSAHAFYVRIECLLYVTMTRLSIAAAICGQLAFSDQLTGSVGNMLLLFSLLQNVEGLLLFVLLASDDMFAKPLGVLKSLWARLPTPAASPPRGTNVVVDLLKEKLEGVGGSTGYDEAPSSGRAIQMAKKYANAAGTIQLAHRRAHTE